MLDWNDIANKSAVALISGGLTWMITSIFKLRRDMNAAFNKIRSIEPRGYQFEDLPETERVHDE